MIHIPSTVTTTESMQIFFDGLRQGIQMRDCHNVKPGATTEGLLRDLKIFEKHALELLTSKPDDTNWQPRKCFKCRGTVDHDRPFACPRCGGTGLDPLLKEKIK